MSATNRATGPDETYMMKQAITTAATMICRSCAMPIAVMIESSENTRSMMMIWTITQANAPALALASCSASSRLDFGMDFVRRFRDQEQAAADQDDVTPGKAELFTVNTSSVSPISHTSRLSSRMRNTSASASPICRARLAWRGGIRER